ncbi:MAG: rhodanese-like domain-containing protein [Myxococcota bacterium]
MDWKIVVVAGVVLAVGWFWWARGAGQIDAGEAKRLVEAGAVLLDVRTPEEFASGHLAGALNIPVQELERRLADVGPREKPVVVYCRSGMRSGRAKKILSQANFSAVHDLGAMSNWR